MLKEGTAVPAQQTRRGQFVRRRPVPPDVLAYRVPQVAARLNVPDPKVWKMIARGEIEARKIGSATVIRAEVLSAYINGDAPVRNAAQ